MAVNKPIIDKKHKLQSPAIIPERKPSNSRMIQPDDTETRIQ